MVTLNRERLAFHFFFPSFSKSEKWVCISCTRTVAKTDEYTRLVYPWVCRLVLLTYAITSKATINSKFHCNMRNQLIVHVKHFNHSHTHAELSLLIVVYNLSCALYNPFSFVENATFCQTFNQKSLTRHMLMLHIKKITVCLRQKSKTLLPETFVDLFDKQSRGDTHCVIVFATS